MRVSPERLTGALANASLHWQQRREEAAGARSVAAASATTIAITREAGAGGSSVARLVGQRLGWHVYDNELLGAIAKEIGVRESLLASVDEQRTHWLQECLSALSSGPSVSDEIYVRHLTEMLYCLAALGDCVIVGRGAAQILPVDKTLRVRLVAALPDRITTVQERLALSAEEAGRWVEKTDRMRQRFIRDIFHKNPDDTHLYDLVINTSRFGFEESADLIVQALRQMQARKETLKR